MTIRFVVDRRVGWREQEEFVCNVFVLIFVSVVLMEPGIGNSRSFGLVIYLAKTNHLFCANNSLPL